MAKRPLPDQHLLKQLLIYEPATGELRWKARLPSHFKDGGHSREHQAARWNSMAAGKVATTLRSDGYYSVCLQAKKYQAHRLIWKLVVGEEPDHIDHIDGNRGNNCIENLRSVDQSENRRNARRASNNKSGVTGVHFAKRQQRWLASIKSGRKSQFLGLFATKAEAVSARKSAERNLGFHPNHGSEPVLKIGGQA